MCHNERIRIMPDNEPDKRLVAIVVAIAVVLVAMVKWRSILFYWFFFVGISSIVLFFQQDYRPRKESMWNLAETRHDTSAVADTQKIAAMAHATESTRDACAAFGKELDRQKTFSVNAQTLCKIRIRTDCPCGGRQWYEKDQRNWLRVYITRGPHKGLDAWVCGSDVSLTVTPL